MPKEFVRTGLSKSSQCLPQTLFVESSLSRKTDNIRVFEVIVNCNQTKYSPVTEMYI